MFPYKVNSQLQLWKIVDHTHEHSYLHTYTQMCTQTGMPEHWNINHFVQCLLLIVKIKTVFFYRINFLNLTSNYKSLDCIRAQLLSYYETMKNITKIMNYMSELSTYQFMFSCNFKQIVEMTSPTYYVNNTIHLDILNCFLFSPHITTFQSYCNDYLQIMIIAIWMLLCWLNHT